MISGLSGSGSSALLQQMRERMMSRLDTDGDGSITQAEFTSGRPKGASEADAAQRFAEIDADGDGSLTETEISSHFQQLAPQTQGALLMVQGMGGEEGGSIGGCGGGGRSKAAADELFSKLDTDGDGSVSKSELEAAFQSIAAADGSDTTTATQQADDLFAKLDADGSGAVSQSETEQAMRPHGHHHGPPPPPSSGAGGDAASSDDVFSSLDANGDGVISKDEFEAATGQSTAASSATATTGSSDDSDPTASLLSLLQGATGQQTANTVRAQMMDLLLKLQGTGATQAAA
jgi:Ca2+-binding EF-hand superfamily protein